MKSYTSAGKLLFCLSYYFIGGGYSCVASYCITMHRGVFRCANTIWWLKYGANRFQIYVLFWDHHKDGGLVVFHHLVKAISHNQLVLLIWHFTHTLTINHTLMMYCVEVLFDSPKKCQNHRCFKTFVSLILLNYNYKEVILTTAIRISLCLPFVSYHISLIDG